MGIRIAHCLDLGHPTYFGQILCVMHERMLVKMLPPKKRKKSKDNG